MSGYRLQVGQPPLGAAAAQFLTAANWQAGHYTGHHPSGKKDFKLGCPCSSAQFLAAATGQRHRAGWPLYSLQSLAQSRAGLDSPKHWHVLAVPVTIRKTSNWAASAAVAPFRAAATGQGHRAGGPLYSILKLALSRALRAGSDSPKLWAREGSPSQKDFKLGCPSCCCTIDSCHKTRPQGRLAIIQSAVSVLDRIGLTKALARAGSPSTLYFRLKFCTVTHKYRHKYIDIYG